MDLEIRLCKYCGKVLPPNVYIHQTCEYLNRPKPIRKKHIPNTFGEFIFWNRGKYEYETTIFPFVEF